MDNEKTKALNAKMLRLMALSMEISDPEIIGDEIKNLIAEAMPVINKDISLSLMVMGDALQAGDIPLMTVAMGEIHATSCNAMEYLMKLLQSLGLLGATEIPDLPELQVQLEAAKERYAEL